MFIFEGVIGTRFSMAGASSFTTIKKRWRIIINTLIKITLTTIYLPSPSRSERVAAWDREMVSSIDLGL